MSRQKLFPLKLPGNYHGLPKKYVLPTEKYLEKSAKRQSFDVPKTKITKWQRTISDNDILQQRREFLVHPAKISRDNPDWLKSTSHYFERGASIPYKRQTKHEHKQYDVFGNRKLDHFASTTETHSNVRYNKDIKEVTPKIGVDLAKHTLLGSRQSKQEVSTKIGFCEIRQTKIRKPQLKVGSLHEKNYVDTYEIN